MNRAIHVAVAAAVVVVVGIVEEAVVGLTRNYLSAIAWLSSLRSRMAALVAAAFLGCIH